VHAVLVSKSSKRLLFECTVPIKNLESCKKNIKIAEKKVNFCLIEMLFLLFIRTLIIIKDINNQRTTVYNILTSL